MTYFLPIKSTSLAHYFACACVKPARYFKNKPQDIQDSFRDALLLSTELGTKDTDCCIELVLTEYEEERLTHFGKDFYLLSIPLPISRVKTVFFRDQRQLEQTVTNINMSTAFIPCSLAKVENFSNANLDKTCVEDLPNTNDFAHSIEMYDRILGALALMKTAKKPYMNYSENYASTLTFFNESIKSELTEQGIQINNKFFGLFEKTEKFKRFIPYLEKEITKEDLDKIAAEEKQKIERSYSKTINYNKLNGNTYIFAILQSYGVGGEAAIKKIDNLIITNFAELKDNMEEAIALYYGYNRGYTIFSNSYGTEETKKQTVKYCLDSQLDYYTIESVYQYAFHSNYVSARFPYLDEWCPKKQCSKGKTDYMVLDTAFTGEKKTSFFSKENSFDLQGEIKKTVDIINTAISSLIDKVVNDIKEKIEDAYEPQIIEVQPIIESLKSQITSLNGKISDLQKEITSLKSTVGKCPTKVEERTGLLQEEKYGSEPTVGEQKDLPGRGMPLGDTSIAVDGSSSKKGGRTDREKSNSTKSSTAPESSKKAASKAFGDEHNNGITETKAPAQDILSKTTSDNGENPTFNFD